MFRTSVTAHYTLALCVFVCLLFSLIGWFWPTNTLFPLITIQKSRIHLLWCWFSFRFTFNHKGFVIFTGLGHLKQNLVCWWLFYNPRWWMNCKKKKKINVVSFCFWTDWDTITQEGKLIYTHLILLHWQSQQRQVTEKDVAAFLCMCDVILH